MRNPFFALLVFGKANLKYILSFVLGMLLMAQMTLIAGVVGYYATGKITDNTARREYARGLYDSCVSFGVNMFGVPAPFAMSECMESVARAMNSGGYYETPSPGFEWPPAAPVIEGEDSQ